MPSLFSTVSKFLASPAGKQLAQRAQRAAKDPATRKKIGETVNQVRGRMGKPR